MKEQGSRPGRQQVVRQHSGRQHGGRQHGWAAVNDDCC
jgi:hypothetical protein